MGSDLQMDQRLRCWEMLVEQVVLPLVAREEFRQYRFRCRSWFQLNDNDGVCASSYLPRRKIWDRSELLLGLMFLRQGRKKTD